MYIIFVYMKRCIMEHDLFLQVVMPRSENLKLSLISIGNIRLLQFPAMYSYGQTLKSLSLVKCSGFKSLFSSPMVKKIVILASLITWWLWNRVSQALWLQRNCSCGWDEKEFSLYGEWLQRLHKIYSGNKWIDYVCFLIGLFVVVNLSLISSLIVTYLCWVLHRYVRLQL